MATVKILLNERGNPAGKVADAELHITEGPLAGLKLIGFGVWERRSGQGHNVTFPARQYAVNGERRSFALLRPIDDNSNADRVRDLILEAYAQVAQAGACEGAVVLGGAVPVSERDERGHVIVPLRG